MSEMWNYNCALGLSLLVWTICNYPINKSSHCIQYKIWFIRLFLTTQENHPSTNAPRDFTKSKNAWIPLMDFINQTPVVQGGSWVSFHRSRNGFDCSFVPPRWEIPYKKPTNISKISPHHGIIWEAILLHCLIFASFITLHMSWWHY